MKSLPRSPPRGPSLLGALGFVAAGLAGCMAPRPGQEASAEDVGRMVAERSVGSVAGRVVEGPSDLDRDARGGDFVDPADAEALARLEEEAEVLTVHRDPEENPYIRFGERIVVRDLADGTTIITKPYPVPTGKADDIVRLLDALEPFPFRPRPDPDPATGARPLDPDTVEYHVVPDWDREFYSNLANYPPAAANPVIFSDLLVVTATPERLEDFEAFVDLFASGVPMIELEAKIIEVVDRDSLDVGVSTTFDFLSDPFVRGFDSAFSNVSDPTEAILTLGALQDRVQFDATIELLASLQNVSIESRPKTVVRAGGVAQLSSTQRIPFFEVKAISPEGNFTINLNYTDVGVTLYIAPRVVGSKKLALDVHLEGSQQVATQTTVQTGGGAAIPVPVIATRTAKSLVYLEPGQTLVIGGLTQERQTRLTDKVPFLGDIPILGRLFRRDFTETQNEHVIFAISPRIVQRSEFTNEL